MATTRKQRKSMANAKMWIQAFRSMPDISRSLEREAGQIDRKVEKRKRKQFRHNAETRP